MLKQHLRQVRCCDLPCLIIPYLTMPYFISHLTYMRSTCSPCSTHAYSTSSSSYTVGLDTMTFRRVAMPRWPIKIAPAKISGSAKPCCAKIGLCSDLQLLTGASRC